MLRFFRLLRKKLIEEGNARKYFFYAIGEIFLVVIGILIALQINNANENRKQDIVRQQYYQQILIDLDKEVVNLNDRLTFLEGSIESYNTYLDVFKTPGITEEQVIDALKEVEFRFEYVIFNTNTIETLQATGDIKLIPIDIRNKLTELKREQDAIILTTSNNDSEYLATSIRVGDLGYSFFFNDRLRAQPVLAKALDIENNYPEIILGLENAFGLKNFTESQLVTFYSTMLEDIQELQTLIQQELED